MVELQDSRQAGALSHDRIEVTPAMIEAGVRALSTLPPFDHYLDVVKTSDVAAGVAAVYKAMRVQSPSS